MSRFYILPLLADDLAKKYDADLGDTRKTWTEVRVISMDSVVIDGPLPEVTRVGDGWYRVGVVEVSPAIAAKAWERAREYAAIAAAYERDHAIDEAQVKALAEDLAMEWGLTISESEVLAIHLIARGWVKGGDPR